MFCLVPGTVHPLLVQPPAQNSRIFTQQLLSHILLGKDAEGRWVSFKYWSLETLVIKSLLTDLPLSEMFLIIIIILCAWLFYAWCP